MWSPPMALYLAPGICLLLVGLIAWIGFRFFRKITIENEEHIIETRSASVVQATQSTVLSAAASCGVAATGATLNSTRSITKKYFVIAKIPLASLSLAAISVVLVLNLSNKHESSEFIPKEYSHSSRIKLTLQEEQLVPPQPLPPEAFRDAINEQPRLSGADRDWNRLNPAFVQTVLRVMARMEARGFPMTLLEGYRSPERQDALAGQATLVTKAKGGQSKHQYGLAVDLAPVRNGKVVISERDPWAMQAYVALGEEAGAASLTWGGNWSFKDYGHIERSGSLKQLLSANNKPTGR